MPTIHYLNVKQGDCSAIQHYSGRISVIDVCNAEQVSAEERARLRKALLYAESGVLGNFNQKQYPVNPIEYLQRHSIESVFRFVLTHPDMDHMDGILDFFAQFKPLNFWDTDNTAEKEFEPESPYDERDWEFYRALRNANPQSDPKRLTLLAGATGQYWNRSESQESGGDGLYILAPTRELVDQANLLEEFNDCSYVILYKTDGHKIVFGGDSHDATWKYILENHRQNVQDVDLLIAPHHGRDSDRSYEYLSVLRPKMTFFGNANSEHLAYDAWNSRNLPFITNNQAGCMIVKTDTSAMRLYVTHKPFAERLNGAASYDPDVQAYYCGDIV